jgi:hypothetical protein
LIRNETSAKSGENEKEIFFKSADEIAKKIEQGFYDLGNEACGIKQGVNRNPKSKIIYYHTFIFLILYKGLYN